MFSDLLLSWKVFYVKQVQTLYGTVSLRVSVGLQLWAVAYWWNKKYVLTRSRDNQDDSKVEE